MTYTDTIPCYTGLTAFCYNRRSMVVKRMCQCVPHITLRRPCWSMVTGHLQSNAFTKPKLMLRPV